tara:strand:- start:1274 stop:1687 length:414 start_codon:yes stop_codon:yes gene_type:complete
MQLNAFFPKLVTQMDYLTLPRDAKVSETSTTDSKQLVGSLTAATTLNLTSSIQVIRSATDGGTTEIETINPPAGQTTPSGIVVLIPTHNTNDYKFMDQDSGTGNLILGADKLINSSTANQALMLIYDKYNWYPLKAW